MKKNPTDTRKTKEGRIGLLKNLIRPKLSFYKWNFINYYFLTGLQKKKTRMDRGKINKILIIPNTLTL